MNLNFQRGFHDWEVTEVNNLSQLLQIWCLNVHNEDQMMWALENKGRFMVKSFYKKEDWNWDNKVYLLLNTTLPIVNFCVWEAWNEKMLTLVIFKGDIWVANRCYLCKKEEETVNHLFLHCEKTKYLWELMFNHFGIKWVMADTVQSTWKRWYCKAIRRNTRRIWKMTPQNY